jgi:regulation of enolase protein 1 (concanavalin A-like superfamily)
MIELAGLPGPFEWNGDAPVSWSAGDGDALDIEAGPRTDLFVPPDGSAPTVNAPRLIAPVDGEFQLRALVDPALTATFDAGVLLVWLDERNWAKLCLERSPRGEATVVSVVTRGVSDDCNSSVVEPPVWMRVARLGPAYAFHVSRDGATWELIRHFALATADDPQVGFLAQSPTGDGCGVTFREVAFSRERLPDLRSGA